MENKVDNLEIVKNYGLKSKSNIYRIYENKDKLMAIASKLNNKRIKTFKRNRGSNYTEVDNALMLWFQTKRQQNAPINGLVLKSKAKSFATQLNIPNFKASNGYISRFAKRNNIKFETKSGESESVDEDTVTQWKNSLKQKYESYAPQDVFNIDETGIYWRFLHNKTYALPEESTKGHKKIKDRVTVLLIVNAEGSERMLVVIGKSENPRCFKGLKNMPIWLYLHNRSAWMTSDLFGKIMLKLNKIMKKQKRNILVMLDNCSSHPKLNFTNIKLMFFPPNTTSRLQPLDAGIIRSFKQRFRNHMIEYIIEILDGNGDRDCNVVVKSITLLKAIYMMDLSLKSIPKKVFFKCFEECGITFENRNSNWDEINEIVEVLYAENNWDSINERLRIGLNNFDDFVSLDNDIVCREEPSDEEIVNIVRALAETNHYSSDTEVDEIYSDSNECNDCPKVPTNTDALNDVFALRIYLGSLTEVDNSYYDLLNKFENLILKNKKSQKQSVITDYFVRNDQ